VDRFRIWLFPDNQQCRVGVERLDNAQRLRTLLHEQGFEVTQLQHIEDTPVHVFGVVLSAGSSAARMRQLFRGVPGAHLVSSPTRLRVTIAPGADGAEELRYAARVRRDLWAHSPVDVDPDDPRNATYRDAERRPYFELTTDLPQEVRRVIREYGHEDRVTLTEVEEEPGPECLNCGNVVGPVFPTVCPNCEMREISPCPYCGQEVPRQNYIPVSGDLFICPECRSRVRVQTNPEQFATDGTFNPPLFLVKRTG
jgi:hypothetical protein